jgi:hypothetical protein
MRQYTDERANRFRYCFQQSAESITVDYIDGNYIA